MGANLGKITFGKPEIHVRSKSYERLSLVKDTNGYWYISMFDVPENIPVTDTAYWIMMFDPFFTDGKFQEVLQRLRYADDIANKGAYAKGEFGASTTTAGNMQTLISIGVAYPPIGATNDGTMEFDFHNTPYKYLVIANVTFAPGSMGQLVSTPVGNIYGYYSSYATHQISGVITRTGDFSLDIKANAINNSDCKIYKGSIELIPLGKA